MNHISKYSCKYASKNPRFMFFWQSDIDYYFHIGFQSFTINIFKTNCDILAVYEKIDGKQKIYINTYISFHLNILLMFQTQTNVRTIHARMAGIALMG